MICEGKTAVCLVSISPLRAAATDTSEMVSQTLFGEIVDVLELTEKWMKVRLWSDGYIGFCDPKQFLGFSEKETKRWFEKIAPVECREQEIVSQNGKIFIPLGACIPFDEPVFQLGDYDFIYQKNESVLKNYPFETALNYLNSPYLWGGKTPFGIDCSGLTQMVFQLHGIRLPRDASYQAEHGSEISFEERQKNDLAFFKNNNGKIIHVGILGENSQLIHASGKVRIDTLYETGIWNQELKSETHQLSNIKRH